MAIIEVNHVSKIYENGSGIYDISFTIDKHGCYGILGVNGAGKSTLFNVLTGYHSMTDICRSPNALFPNGGYRLGA